MILPALLLQLTTTTTLCPEPGGVSVHTGYQFGPRKDCHAVIETILIPTPPVHGIPARSIGEQLCPNDVCPGNIPLLKHQP